MTDETLQGTSLNDSIRFRYKGASASIKRTKQKAFLRVVDGKTGKAAVKADVEAIHWLAKDKAEGEGGYVCESFCIETH